MVREEFGFIFVRDSSLGRLSIFMLLFVFMTGIITLAAHRPSAFRAESNHRPSAFRAESIDLAIHQLYNPKSGAWEGLGYLDNLRNEVWLEPRPGVLQFMLLPSC